MNSDFITSCPGLSQILQRIDYLYLSPTIQKQYYQYYLSNITVLANFGYLTLDLFLQWITPHQLPTLLLVFPWFDKITSLILTRIRHCYSQCFLLRERKEQDLKCDYSSTISPQPHPSMREPYVSLQKIQKYFKVSFEYFILQSPPVWVDFSALWC